MTSSFWPLFDLTITGPTLAFRYPRDEDLAPLARIVDDIRRQPGLEWFWVPLNGADGGLPSQTRAAQQIWSWRASWTPVDWILPLVALRDSEVVGLIEVSARDFSILRTAELGLWIDPAQQRRGYGKETAAAGLSFVFHVLDADEARWGAPSDNPASLALARSLGFLDNGVTRVSIAGRRIDEELFRLPRTLWQQSPRPSFDVGNVETCLSFFFGQERR